MEMKKIYIINGPNLNLLGKRETNIYGDMAFEAYFIELKNRFAECELYYFQSNHEGRLIDKMQEIGFLEHHSIILNAGGYTHTSIALGDTVAAIDTPVIEVHISNIMERESFRHHSFIKPHSKHFIAGKGMNGYAEAIEFILEN